MSWRIALRLQRFELIALAGVTLAWATAAIVATFQMNALSSIHPECFGSTPLGGAGCPGVVDRFAPWQQFGAVLLQIAFFAPFVFGVVLGVPIVAREIEQNTAQLSWSLAVRRVPWLMARSWPVALVLVLVLGVMGLVGEQLMSAWQTGLDPGFLLYDQRGLLLPLRGLFAFSLAVLVGLWLGRTLPGLLLAGLAITALAVGVGIGVDAARRSDAVVLSQAAFAADADRYFGSLVLPNVWVAPDGTVTYSNHLEDMPAGGAQAFWMVPPWQFWKWLTIEAGALVALIGVTSGLTARSIRRRRPL